MNDIATQTATAHVALVADVVKPTAATPRVIPTVSQPVRIPWGAWIEQGLIHEAAMIKVGANAGLSFVEGLTPMGWAIKLFAGQEVVDGLIDQGLKALEGIVDTQAIVVDATEHPVYAYVANMINTTLPNLTQALGPKLDELIKSGLAKVGIKI